VSALNVRTLNFLTDDPWNPVHRARWALKALAAYDCICSPRQANLADLRQLGAREVRYVPFAYDPRHAFREAADPALAWDVIFVGGADTDRTPWMSALFDAGFRVGLYGDYWERFRETRGKGQGQSPPAVIRRATASSKVALCLVRRANRDGHVMRSFEIAATGACMLVEDTDEHRAIFGPPGECVEYFRTPGEMVAQVRKLVADPERRERLLQAAYERVATPANTYTARLKTMLDLA
jgi:spore maturation protein CgeB